MQGRRLKLQVEFRATLENVFSELSLALKNSSLMPKSAMAADLVTIGDSWLSLALSRGLIEPIEGAEELEWFKGLNDRWKVIISFFFVIVIGDIVFFHIFTHFYE